MYTLLKISRQLFLVLVLSATSATVFSQTLSDAQIKKNVTDIERPLDRIMKLEPRIFEFETKQYKHLKLRKGRQYGFLSDNMQATFPELVKIKHVRYMFGKNFYRDARFKTIDNTSLIPILVASIQQQQQEINMLRESIENLKQARQVSLN